jgi:lipopolysaccharide/colanic/teichoic acid biosynthesis glycosyltransferase
MTRDVARAYDKSCDLLEFAAQREPLGGGEPAEGESQVRKLWPKRQSKSVKGAYHTMSLQSEPLTPIGRDEAAYAFAPASTQDHPALPGIAGGRNDAGSFVGQTGASSRAALLVAPAADHRAIAYRIAEKAAALGALIFFAPLLLFMAILIKLDSPGPVFFKQKRLTRGGRPFTFVKLRSMAVDGNRRFPGFSPAAINARATGELRLQFSNDPRVTRIGHWLRRTSIDEIPNFLHVLTGHMALVGPRPEMPEYLSHYSAEQLAKFSILPGITGYAQIYGRGDLSFLETVEFDLRYIDERSTATDLRVLRETIGGVIACRGAQ